MKYLDFIKIWANLVIERCMAVKVFFNRYDEVLREETIIGHCIGLEYQPTLSARYCEWLHA